MAAFHVSFTVVVLENEVMYGAQFEMSDEAMSAVTVTCREDSSGSNRPLLSFFPETFF